MNRREFLGALAATGLFASKGHASAPFPVQFRQTPPYAPVMALVEPGLDEFPGEKTAMEIEARLAAALRSGRLPLTAGSVGTSPEVRSRRDIAPGVAEAVFGESRDLEAGWKAWRESLGTIRAARFYSLPGDLVRFDIRGSNRGRLEHRVGLWKQSWTGGTLARFEPLAETLTYADKPWFRDVTGYAFAGEGSFHDQLARGVPYWRSCLDPACGIDVYGENGIAAADTDGDGVDEIYVCQPGGLPNRLYKNDGKGRFRDIARESGLDLLDDTASALFVDLRNSGHQDLVLVRSNQPLLFLNDGTGRFREHRMPSASPRTRKARSPEWPPPIMTATAAWICISAATSTSRAKRSTAIRFPTTMRRTARPISSSATASTKIQATSRTSPHPAE